MVKIVLSYYGHIFYYFNTCKRLLFFLYIQKSTLIQFREINNMMKRDKGGEYREHPWLISNQSMKYVSKDLHSYTVTFTNVELEFSSVLKYEQMLALYKYNFFQCYEPLV